VTEQLERRLLVTTAGTMFQLSIGRTNLYTLFTRGDLTPIKIGGRVYVAQAEIDAYVDRLTNPAS
jgi:hypothetical protein